jgi:hypothetical protein
MFTTSFLFVADGPSNATTRSVISNCKFLLSHYNLLLTLLIRSQIAYHLAHFMSVIKHLEPAWARALLKRTRFMDTDFQADLLAVLSKCCGRHVRMSSLARTFLLAMISAALRTGHPLPQITPCPLLDRFLTQSSGLDILHRETEEDYGLPRTLTLDTLQNEQYL